MGESEVIVSPAPVMTAVPTEMEQLDQDIPAHLLALYLLGLGNLKNVPIKAWPQKEGRPVRPRPEDQTTAVAIAVNMVRPLLFVRNLNQCYILANGSKHLYRPVEDEDIKEWVVAIWNKEMKILGGITPKKKKDCIEMVKDFAHNTEKDINRRFISITPTLFWDTEKAILTEEPEGPCFFRLFDTPSPTQHYLRIEPFTEEQVERVKEGFKENLEYMNAHNGDLPEDYDFVTLWADYSHDVYMDIIKAAASPFMRRKPFGAFMLAGMSRTGKTVFSNDLMKTMLGTKNCSGITLANLGNPHQNAALQWTLYNAPDEEDEKTTQYEAIFKTICDHGQIKVDRYYSQDPIPVDCDFPCAFPMNHKPVWTGVGANACVQRSLIIEFTHVFGDEDKSPEKFSERTFTADLFSRLLGTLFAVAAYYREHDIGWSDTLYRQQDSLAGEMDSHSTYYSHFIAFFDGFQSINQIYADYKIWCGAHDMPISSPAAFRLAFGPFINTKQKKIKAFGREARGYRIIQSGKKPLINSARYDIGVPEALWRESIPLSVVERKEAKLEEIFGDGAEDELNRLVMEARMNMASRRIEVPEEVDELEQLTLGEE